MLSKFLSELLRMWILDKNEIISLFDVQISQRLRTLLSRLEASYSW